MSTRYNTGNPIESTDVRDMSDNAKNFDEFSNSMSDSFTDRFGVDRQTMEGAVRKAGFRPASFDFLTGGSLVSGDRNKAVFNPAPLGDNNWYAWQGAFPKIISPNSTPSTSGGLDDNAWKPVTNNILAPTVMESIRRSYSAAGYNLVDGSFEAGGTLVNANDVLLQERTGKAFTGPAGTVAAGTNPASGGFVDVSNRLQRHFDSVSSAVADVYLVVGNKVVVDNYHTNGNSGVLFFNVVAAGTGVADGGKYINTTNGLQLMQNLRQPMSPSAWGAKADGTDDSPSINAMISYFKSALPTPPANKNYDAKGKGVDFSGYTNSLAATVDFSGIDNLSIYNPSFVGLSGFVGTELAKFSSLDPTWYVENITLWNPYFDCNWNVDLGFDAADFLNFKVMGGKITHYRKKGFRTRRINVGPHEVNLVGTFLFQREDNEVYPVDITEGEAFEIGNYDNNFTNVIVGYQKKWAGTLVSGANIFINCHFYSGTISWPESGLRSLDTADDFIGCYFDYTPLFLKNRSTVDGCSFVISPARDYAINLDTNEPFLVKIVNSRFRKESGPSVAAIKMKTMAEGRTIRPDIYDNKADGCTVIQTRGGHEANITSSTTTFTVPDQYLPLGSFGPVRLASNADGGASQAKIFSQEYNSTTKQITIRCYSVTGGGLVDSNLGGKTARIDFNQ